MQVECTEKLLLCTNDTITNMKNSLHFKHFRKFKDFQTLEFNDITFLVGKNNSGKSTFVKAILLT